MHFLRISLRAANFSVSYTDLTLVGAVINNTRYCRFHKKLSKQSTGILSETSDFLIVLQYLS